jgi:hypothetical protein
MIHLFLAKNKIFVQNLFQQIRVNTMLSTPKSHKEPNPKHDDVVHMTRTLSPSTTTAVTTTTTGILHNNSNLM